MLKFVSKTQNDKKFDDLIKEELGEKTSILDFLSNSTPNQIKEKIYETLKDVKLKSRKEEMCYTKLIYYFSLVINDKMFNFDEKAKKCIDNLIIISEEEKFIQIFEDLYNLFVEEQSNIKKYILQKILDSKYEFTLNDYIVIYCLIINYFCIKKVNIKENEDILEKFAKLVDAKKNYDLLPKIKNVEHFLTKLSEYNQQSDSVNKSVLVSKLFFFLNMSSPDLVDVNFEDKLKLNDSLKKEIELIGDMYDRKDAKILFETKQGSFADAYGEKGDEIILMAAKETSIQELLKSNESDKIFVVKFKEFINQIYEDEEGNITVDIKDNEIQGKFEEIEDVIISGNDHKLYNVVIDYAKQEIKILYVRKQSYEKKDKEILLDKVKKMKSNLETILKAIEKI